MIHRFILLVNHAEAKTGIRIASRYQLDGKISETFRLRRECTTKHETPGERADERTAFPTTLNVVVFGNIVEFLHRGNFLTKDLRRMVRFLEVS